MKNNLFPFVQIMKGCWQDIWDIENKRNDWIFDEFTRFLFIKLHEDAKPDSSFTMNKLRLYAAQTKKPDERAAQYFINELFTELKCQHPDVFTNAEERVLSRSRTIEHVITRLEKINLKNISGDVLGRAFEIMLSDTFKGKDLGQFFTPREIVTFMLELGKDVPEQPILDVTKGQRFLDACAGSGGFVTAVYEDAYNYLLSLKLNNEKQQRLLQRLGQDTFFACEIEEKAARLGKLNMIVHAVDAQSAQWLHQNYLYNEEYGGLNPHLEYEVDFGQGKKKQVLGPESVDLVLTNPPFGKSVKAENILLNYHFGHDFKFFKTKGRLPEKRAKNSQESEILFIEHYLQVLKPGGKLLIVLPDGVLSNTTAKPIRDFIRQHALIKAVISLPSETFASTGTSIPTNVLYVQKKCPGEVQGDIFMAKANAVGRRANGEPSKDNDLPLILEKFRQWQAS